MLASDGDVIPHGGYDSTTNSCLFCHDIHEASGDYVLMRQTTVIETCGTCHDIYLDSENWSFNQWDNPNNYPGDTPLDKPEFATVSDLAVYEVDYTEKDNVGGHKISRGDGIFTFADGAEEDANYIPGGTLTLNILANAAENGYNAAYPETEDSTEKDATAGLYCASCHTPHGEFGQILRAATYDLDNDGVKDITEGSDGRGKLLSSRPNHSEEVIEVDDWQDEGFNWCASCHDLWLDEASGGSAHNHPSSYCLDCHGSYVGVTDEPGYPDSEDVTDDFPHTSPAEVQNLLQEIPPDALCLRCHVEGEYP